MSAVEPALAIVTGAGIGASVGLIRATLGPRPITRAAFKVTDLAVRGYCRSIAHEGITGEPPEGSKREELAIELARLRFKLGARLLEGERAS